jgi:hypothetical protein
MGCGFKSQPQTIAAQRKASDNGCNRKKARRDIDSTSACTANATGNIERN